MLTQIDNDPGYLRVASALEQEILSGRLRLGEYLPTEAELSAQLGVHRSTVREGIRALENAGLVRRGAGKRLMVSAPEPNIVAHANSRAMRLMQVNFVDLWTVQMQLEPLTAHLAAINPSQEHRVALKKNVENLKKNLHDDDHVIRNDIEFHRLIAEASRNQVLAMATAPIGNVLFSATRHLYSSVPQARYRLLEAHEAILDAVQRENSEDSETWMKRHIEDFRRGYEVGGLDISAPLPLDA